MSALRLPHAAARKQSTSLLSANQERESADLAADVAFDCQLTPMASLAAFEQFNVEVSRPFLIVCEVADAQAVVVGDVIAFDGKEYAVKAPPQVYDGIGAADHGSFVVEEVALS